MLVHEYLGVGSTVRVRITVGVQLPEYWGAGNRARIRINVRDSVRVQVPLYWGSRIRFRVRIRGKSRGTGVWLVGIELGCKKCWGVGFQVLGCRY